MKERKLIGKYRVVTLLGRGGMGDVFLTLNVGPSGVSKLVVVKVLREELALVPEARSMFLDEARVSTRLNHPNVVQTYEVVLEGETLYLAMEFLDGQPLQNLIRGPKSALVPLTHKLRILVEVLAALHYAHELSDYDGRPLNVVHRDVSPHNVIVTYEGTAKLVDFGIAKAANARTVTESGVFKGKVRFASPEQVVGEAIDRRADVFAAGAILWEMLTGQQMWVGVADTKVLVELATGRIPGPRTVAPEVPEALDAICRKALAFEPGDRFPTASDFKRALVEYLRNVPPPDRELGTVLAEAFAVERSALRAEVDEEVQALCDDAAGTTAGGPDRAPATATADRGSLTSVATAQVSPPRPLADRHWGRALIGAGAALAGALSLWLFQRGVEPGALQPSAAASGLVAETATPPLSTTVAPPPPTRARIRATPPAATLLVDGERVAGNPYAADVPGVRRSHHVRAEAPGFAPQETDTAFDEDVVLVLTPVPRTAAPRARPRRISSERGPEADRAAAATTTMPRGTRPIEEDNPYRP